MARIAVGGFQHETNTFAPKKADLDDFEKGGGPLPPLVSGEALFEAVAGSNTPAAGFAEAARARGHDLVGLLLCGTMPSGAVTERAFETICGRLVDEVRSAGPLDAIYLDLHGAMVAEHVEDGEGELLHRLRAVTGPDLPIVVSLDYHANVTPQMMALSHGLVAYRTYPHVDRAETGARAARHLDELLRGRAATARAFRQVPFLIPITWQCTETEPTRSIVRLVKDLERDDVSLLSYVAGFPLADIHHCGPAVFAYARTQAAADRAVNAVYEEIMAREPDFVDPFFEPGEAVRLAQKLASETGKPIVLADTQDNPGAGGAGDTTGLLAAMVEANAEGAVLALLHDPAAAAAAHRAGEGHAVEIALGGKSGEPGDAPFKARFEVERITDGVFTGTGPMYRGIRFRLGPTAVLRIGGVRVVVSSNRAQAGDRSILRHVGLEPAAQKIIGLKSSVHFRADFGPIAGKILVVVAPGSNTADTRDIPYRRLRPGLRISPGSKVLSRAPA